MMVADTELEGSQELYTDSDDDEGDYSGDEEIVEELFSPRTFEDYQNMYKNVIETVESPALDQIEMGPENIETADEAYTHDVSSEIDNIGSTLAAEPKEINSESSENLEENVYGDEDFIDEEESDESLDSEEMSDIDDSDLMKRLEAKYGKISDKSSEDGEELEDSWTSK